MTRSLSPAPTTLPLADVRRLNAVRERLCHALRVADTLGALRAYVTELASDIEEVVDPTSPAVREDDASADTERAPVGTAPWDSDTAPPTPRDSDLGEEYGV